MPTPLEEFYLQKEEPIRECLLALSALIQSQDQKITAEWKYKMPFFYYQGKMLCYLWVHKTFKQPYIGFADGYGLDHPELIQEKRARMKILLLDPLQDLPVDVINHLIKAAIALH